MTENETPALRPAARYAVFTVAVFFAIFLRAFAYAAAIHAIVEATSGEMITTFFESLDVDLLSLISARVQRF